MKRIYFLILESNQMLDLTQIFHLSQNISSYENTLYYIIEPIIYSIESILFFKFLIKGVNLMPCSLSINSKNVYRKSLSRVF